VSELEIDEVLMSFRARRDRFLDLSFPTIAGVGPNGAVIHYRATEATNRSGSTKLFRATTPCLYPGLGSYARRCGF
jgi:Xaa-Pro aminopeptidase